MDSITHIALGACTAELFLTKKLGKKALMWGIVAQNLPDIDVVAALFVSPEKAILFHRGITHSLLFALIAGIGLAVLAKKIHHKINIPITSLVFFFCFQLALHDVLDTCNSYGTGLLEPFSHHRFTVNLLYVADPLFTLGLLVVCLYLVFKRSDHNNRVKWALAALGFSFCYLCFAGINKFSVDRRIDNEASIPKTTYFSTPAPFNCMLWYVVGRADSGYYTGYLSVWDKKPLGYTLHQKNAALLNNAGDKQVVADITRFADGYYTVMEKRHAIYINILRFGQIQGWQWGDAPFALSYPVSAPGNQEMLLQKGRMAGWNAKSVKLYFKRILGE